MFFGSSLNVDGRGKAGWSQGAVVHYGTICMSQATAPHTADMAGRSAATAKAAEAAGTKDSQGMAALESSLVAMRQSLLGNSAEMSLWSLPTLPTCNKGGAVQVEITENFNVDTSRPLTQEWLRHFFAYTMADLCDMNAGPMVYLRDKQVQE